MYLFLMSYVLFLPATGGVYMSVGAGLDGGYSLALSQQTLPSPPCTCTQKSPPFSVLVIDHKTMHRKLRWGLDALLEGLGWPYEYGDKTNIAGHDVVFVAQSPLPFEKYPNTTFIFGPQFSVFPDDRSFNLRNDYCNGVYIQPSQWATDASLLLWKKRPHRQVRITSFPFPVDTTTFASTRPRTSVFVYYKTRHPKEKEIVSKAMRRIPHYVFDYDAHYNEAEYRDVIGRSKYGIVLGRCESQGFAIEEALSSDTPLLVWSVKLMSEEYGSGYPDIAATTVPYWDASCGEVVYTASDFLERLPIFIENAENKKYSPRKFIVETLSVAALTPRFVDLIQNTTCDFI